MTSRGANEIASEAAQNLARPIPKVWILSCNERKLLFPGPALDLLFPSNGDRNVSRAFPMHESHDSVPGGEAPADLLAVLAQPASQIVGDTGI